MNLNFNLIKNLTVKTRFKTLIMGILLIAATFLMASNTNGIVFAQAPPYVKVTISKLPKQTADASAQVTLSQTGSNNDYHGSANINIPGIGSGNVEVNYVLDVNKGTESFDISVSNLPGQGGPSDTLVYSENGYLLPKPIDIPGIGIGTLKLF
jgi:hypothetical protein